VKRAEVSAKPVASSARQNETKAPAKAAAKAAAKSPTVKASPASAAKTAVAGKPVVSAQAAKTVKTAETAGAAPQTKLNAMVVSLQKAAARRVEQERAAQAATTSAPGLSEAAQDIFTSTAGAAEPASARPAKDTMTKSKSASDLSRDVATPSTAPSEAARRLMALSRAKGVEPKATETKLADKPAEAKPSAPLAGARPAAAPAAPAKAATPAPAKLSFKLSEYIVYPAHGVGQIVEIENKEVAGFKLELYVINFIKDKMILRVPTAKAATFGMRKLAEAATVKKALDTLTGRARVKRTMWSRRAQEYEAKINSGDLISIAEVVRDLYRSDAQPEQSYSERQLYEAALDRVAREIAAVQKLTETEALKLIEGQLQKGPKRGGKADAAEGAAAEGEDGDVEEAA
jgi:CarD family transcriptional regulator